MGLLDWVDQEDDLFPDFNAGLSPPKHSSLTKPMGSSANLFATISNTWGEDPNANRSRGDSIASSTDSSPTYDSPRDPLEIPVPVEYSSKANNKVSRLARSRPKTRRTNSEPCPKPPGHPLHKRRPSFDLFGIDEELQDAESRIGFCDICLKHCDKHQ